METETENSITEENLCAEECGDKTAEEETAATGTEGNGRKNLSPRMKQFLQILKFTAFSASAGVIQLLSFSVLYEWTRWLPWWPSYLISIILSVIWNFTFNRKFTFASSANVPLAMALVIVYYCAFIPVSVFGGNALEKLWGEKLGIVVTVLMMVINFVTEFVWDKFIVFNHKIIARLERFFRRKDK